MPILSHLIWFASFLAAGPADTTSQANPPTGDSSPIVVQGERDRDEAIQAFIKLLTPTTPRGQLARFEAPLCPSIRGLTDDQARILENRMRTVAADANIILAKPKCAPNLFIFVTDDKRGLMEKLAQRPGMFPDEWSMGQIRALAADTSPITAWQTGQSVWQDGFSISGRETAAPDNKMAPTTGGNTPGHTFFTPHGVATRMNSSARPTFDAAVLVVSFDALAGVTPTQFADYALMRSLIKIEPANLKDLQSRTILNLFDTSPNALVASSITPWDLSFLKSYYASTKNMYAEYQRAQMKGEMKRELARLQANEEK